MNKSLSESKPSFTPQERAEMELLTKEMKRRFRPPFLDFKFKAQTEFIQDPAKLKVALCTRRSGKSYGAGSYLFREAYNHPGVSCLYVALTRDEAKRIMWKDVLKVINRNLELNCKFNENALTCTLPNGSIIYLLGADSNEDEKDKLLGQKYQLVVIDESSKYSIDLHELIYDVLKPAVADYRGTIVMIGTPSNLRRGLYYDLTKAQNPEEPSKWQQQGWSGHCWSAFHNPYMKTQWQEEISELKAANPHIEETPGFQQNYLGRWTIDDKGLVYAYQTGRNDFKDLPELDGHLRGRWHLVLGVDLGYDDPSAFSLCAYHDFDKALYVLSSYKEAGMDVTDVAAKIRFLNLKAKQDYKVDIDCVVIDNANKQAVMEMRRRHDLQLTPADKTGKSDFIELMNAEFTMGRVKLCVGDCQVLADEYSELIWDPRSAKREEHPACANHCSDATLYAWRHCYAYLSNAPKVGPRPYSPEWYAAEAQAMEQTELARLEEQKEQEKQYEEDGLYW